MAVKGKTNNPNGRPKGAPNKVTADLRKAVSDLIEMNWDRIQDDLDGLDGRDRLTFIEKLLAYVLPKQSAVKQETTVISKLEGLTDEQLVEMADMIISKNQKDGQEEINQRHCG